MDSSTINLHTLQGTNDAEISSARNFLTALRQLEQVVRVKTRGFDLVSVVVWCGVVWCGVVWCGVVWCGVVWCGVVKCVVRIDESRD